MTDMRVNLTVKARGTGTGAIDQTTKSVEAVGKTAQTTGAKVKQTLRWQNGAWKEVRQNTSAAGAEVKRLGGTLERMGTQGRRATETVRRGMQDDGRELRRTTSETMQLGRGLDRLRLAALRSTSAIRTVAIGARQEFDRLHKVLGGVGGRLATLGLGLGAVSTIKTSATLDRQLIRSSAAVGMSNADRDDWRAVQWALARKNGNDRSEIQRAFDAVGSSLPNYAVAKQSAMAIDTAMTISGADPESLGAMLVTTANMYGYDLAKPGVANTLLAQGYAGGNLGSAELNKLAPLFSHVAPSAKMAGMSYPQTIGFVEAMSNFEQNPEKLGTLVESTLRMFTKEQYRTTASKATGVSFYNKDGSGRNPFDVLKDMRSVYSGLKTKAQKDDFMAAVLGQADQDTVRGFSNYMMPGAIERGMAGGGKVAAVTDFDQARLAENRDSATATAGRVRATVGEALDKAAQPINAALASAAQYLLDDKQLSGGDLLAGGAALGLGGYYGGRLAKWAGGKAGGKLVSMLGGNLDTVKNIVVGRALEQSTGVTPVFVTNWSGAPAASGLGAPAAAVEGGAAARVAAGRVASTARGFVLSDLLWAAGGAVAIQQVNEALAPTKLAVQASLQAKGRSADAKALGLANDDQMAQWDALRAKVPYDAWRGQHKGGVGDYESWLTSQVVSPTHAAARLDSYSATATPAEQMQQAALILDAARRGLEAMLGRPLQIEVTSDTPELHAKLNERHVRDARRG